jgi:hypothetical protein
MNDPVAVALMCQRMVDAVLEALCGIPIIRNSRKTKVIPVEKMQKCAFGRSHAYFWVTELMGRDQLHWHILLWGGIPNWLSQACAGALCDNGSASSLGDGVSEILESSYSACSSARIHALRLLDKVDGVVAERPALYCPPISGTDGPTISKLVMLWRLVRIHTLIARHAEKAKLVRLYVD